MKQMFTAATLAALALGIATPVLAQVTVTDAWARGTVAAAKSSGAFMRIESKQDARLVGIQTPVAMGELHQMAMQGDRMTMARVDGIDLPAGKPVDLAPGGYHVMLMGLNRQLKEGDTVPLTLVIEKNGKRENVPVQATVKPLTYVAPASPPRH
jgi:copper(I)-binding protein